MRDFLGGTRKELWFQNAEVKILSCKCTLAMADYAVKDTPFAANLFLLSKTSSDAYKTYTGLIKHGEESLTPGGTSEMATSKHSSWRIHDVGGSSAALLIEHLRLR